MTYISDGDISDLADVFSKDSGIRISAVLRGFVQEFNHLREGEASPEFHRSGFQGIGEEVSDSREVHVGCIRPVVLVNP